MARKTWLLTQASSQTWLEQLALPAAELGLPPGCALHKQALRCGLSQGVDVVHVDNGAIAFSVLPTRGMGVWKARRGELEVGWRSPVRGPVHPAFVDLGEPSGLGWLDGFDELLARCGLESNGAPEFDEKTGRLTYPLHGRVANRPAHEVAAFSDPATGALGVTGVVEETRFHFLKLRLTSTIVTRPGADFFEITDEIENLSASPAEAQLLYHVNLGAPLLDAGSRLVAPVKTLVPRNARAAEGIDSYDAYSAPEAAFPEQVYFFDLAADSAGETQVLLKNAHGTAGVGLAWPKAQLPCFTTWKNTTALADGYVTGLEPATNYPNPRTYEGRQGRVVKLAPGGKHVARLKLTIFAGAAEVGAAEKAIVRLTAGAPPTLHRQPQTGWCADA